MPSFLCFWSCPFFLQHCNKNISIVFAINPATRKKYYTGERNNVQSEPYTTLLTKHGTQSSSKWIHSYIIISVEFCWFCLWLSRYMAVCHVALVNGVCMHNMNILTCITKWNFTRVYSSVISSPNKIKFTVCRCRDIRREHISNL